MKKQKEQARMLEMAFFGNLSSGDYQIGRFGRWRNHPALRAPLLEKEGGELLTQMSLRNVMNYGAFTLNILLFNIVTDDC